MRVYLLSLAAGLLVGVVYSLLKVRSPAPPMVALVGLFGILVGEQLIPLGKRVLAGQPLTVAWASAGSHQHLFGRLPNADRAEPRSAETMPIVQETRRDDR